MAELGRVLRSPAGLWPVLQELGGDWKVLDLSSIIDIAGIWEAKSNVYILRKHPALAMLSGEELGNAEEGNKGEDTEVDGDL